MHYTQFSIPWYMSLGLLTASGYRPVQLSRPRLQKLTVASSSDSNSLAPQWNQGVDLADEANVPSQDHGTHLERNVNFA